MTIGVLFYDIVHLGDHCNIYMRMRMFAKLDIVVFGPRGRP